MTSHPHSQPDTATPGPWTVSEVRSVEGEYLVVGGVGQEFGLIASCPVKADAELIVSLRNQCGVQNGDDSALRAALKPFADGADYYDDANLSPGEHPWRDDHPANPVFKVGQLRAARAALALPSADRS